MRHHLRLIAGFTLSFIVLSSLFSMNMFSLNKIYAQEGNPLADPVLTLPLPRACVYDDGDDPKLDPDECEEISNNEETLGSNNVFFTLNSPRSFDSFTCTLQDKDAGIVITTFDCTISHNVAEADLPDLDDGDYAFTVTASRTSSDNDPDTTDIVEEAASPPFNFRIGIGGGGDGADFADFGETGADVPPSATGGGDPLLGFDRLNPIWRECNSATIKGSNAAAVQNGLVGMKYIAQGTIFFKDFVQQLNKFNTNDFVLEIKVNFFSGVMVAELFPTIRDIDPIKTQESLYELDPLLVTNEQNPRDGTNSPNRVPFEVESIETKCLYSAPKIATSWDIEGMDVPVNEDVFEASNPPFRQCVESSAHEGATYKITFTLNDKDKKNLLQGHKEVLFTIFQQLSGEAPEYHGFLSFNPYEDDEKRISLSLDGKDILTECKTKLLY